MEDHDIDISPGAVLYRGLKGVLVRMCHVYMEFGGDTPRSDQMIEWPTLCLTLAYASPENDDRLWYVFKYNSHISSRMQRKKL